MKFDDQARVKIVRAIVVVNGEVSMAAARGDGDEVGVSHQIGPAVNEVYAEWPERLAQFFEPCVPVWAVVPIRSKMAATSREIAALPSRKSRPV